MRLLLLSFAAIALASIAQDLQAAPAFYAFESDPVRPLALSAGGNWLYVVNTPDARLEVFELQGAPGGLPMPRGSVPVGLEPVAVAVRSPHEVWVVNHLSDSVSIVDTSEPPGRVVRTLLVGDEPRDVVFAGPEGHLAFVTAAHRGQNAPDPRGQYASPGAGRADVWVFDADRPGSSLGGDPVAVLTLFGDKPRALAASPDGSRVYAAVFRSGNRTTTVGELFACVEDSATTPCSSQGAAPGPLPPPDANIDGAQAPRTGLIVRQDATGRWLDELGRDWGQLVRFQLPDLDVFEIDATRDPPEPVAAFAGVGTVLYNMAVDPVTGALYVSNTEARNEVRFEGRGTLAASVKPAEEPASVRGHLHEARITVIDSGGVHPRHLNPHIPYGVAPVPEGVKEQSLATPLGVAVSSDGQTLYVAAFGSSRIGVFDVADLEDGSLGAAGDASDGDSGSTGFIELGGGGPSGVVLDEDRGRLYTLTRFDNALAIVDLNCRCEVMRWPLYNPEPTSLTEGRRFLYDARLTSSNGEASCAGCHVFGDVDDLAWDLGDPDAPVKGDPNPSSTENELLPFHPIKGPMTTQTLRGLDHHGPMHWRGDRTGASDPQSQDAFDEVAAFEAFNVAFGGLLGRDEGPLSETEIRAFAEFALQLVPPPNPIRQLDGSLRSDEARGREVFLHAPTTLESLFPPRVRTCHSCHRIDRAAGLFGTDGRSTNIFEQPLKAPPLRAVYQKIGMFGFPELDGVSDGARQGPQIRGFGFTHDGSRDTLFRFLSSPFFLLQDQERADVEAFLMAFPGDLAPIVGQQVTLSSQSGPEAQGRVDLLLERAAARLPRPDDPDATECDLIVKGTVANEARGWVRVPDGSFRSDRQAEPELADSELRALAQVPGQELTYTCAPPGAGLRMGIDRDEDGTLDGDECVAAEVGSGVGSPPPTSPGACDADLAPVPPTPPQADSAPGA